MNEEQIARVTAIQDVIGRHTHGYVKPICLGTNELNAHSVIENGSWFALRVGDHAFGVTAAHVLRRIPKARVEYRHLDVMMGGECRLPLWESDRLIEIDDEFDIGTFRISDNELQLSGIKVWACPARVWPPAPPKQGAKILVTGFPGIKRKVHGAKDLVLEQIPNALVVDSISDNVLTSQMEPGSLSDSTGKRIEPGEIDWGGYSGGAVWHLTEGAIMKVQPTGVVMEATIVHDNALLRIARIDKIGADGHLVR